MKYIFETNNLSYTYPGNILSLREINLAIAPGELVGLLGANGSGKSTLLKIMDGLIFPSSGEILAFGKSLSEKALREEPFALEFRRRVGLVFQDPDVQLFSPTVWDEVAFGPLQLGLAREEIVSRASEVLELLDIGHLLERPPYRLSSGEKKKVSIASVLSVRPEVLLLDEPTAGLDPRSQANLIDFLMHWPDEGKTLIVSTQDLDVLEYSIKIMQRIADDPGWAVLVINPGVMHFVNDRASCNGLVEETPSLFPQSAADYLAWIEDEIELQTDRVEELNDPRYEGAYGETAKATEAFRDELAATAQALRALGIDPTPLPWEQSVVPENR